MRRSLRANIAANVLGRFFTAICGIAFVPIYLHFLGVEYYGLFALLNSYMIVAALLDAGFSAALTREIARFSESEPQRMRDLVWTISLPYCAVTLVLALAIYLASPWIASVILREARDVHEPMIIASVGFAGFAMTLQLPVFLSMGGLAGLQRQDLANGITIASTALRYGGSLFLLWSFPRSVPTLMIWQAVVAVLTAVATFVVLWRHLPAIHRQPRFQRALLLDIWRFAAGSGGAALLGVLVFQSDKLFIGALLPLKEVGIYMVASVIATNLMMLAQPISAAAFPRLSQLYARVDVAGVRATFHKLSQLVTAIVLPVATVIAFFPQQTLAVWTGNIVVAADAAPILSLLVIGVACNALGSVPYSLILAAGRTRPLLLSMTAICALVLPSLYFLTVGLGTIGTATAMLCYLLLLLAALASLVRPLLGSREWWRWISVDIFLSLALILLVVAVAETLAPVSAPKYVLLLMLAATWFAAAFAAALVLPSVRDQALSYLRKLRAQSFRPAN
jgi:O-antigen/teichoic acid export membrane protein